MEISDMEGNVIGWGGRWTEQKLDTFESYVKAYLTIMNVYRDKYNWRLIYFDGFAGCGSRGEEEERIELQRTLDIVGSEAVNIEELNLYKGAAERVVRLEDQMKGFDFYYFIDIKEENCTRLELKLAQYPTTGLKQFRPGDANHWTEELANAMKRDTRLKSLVLLDPFGMNIKWSTIESIAGKSVDLWILLPSGVIINRLLEKDGSLAHFELLEQFFGMEKEAIRNWFYDQVETQNLFGETEKWYEKKENPIKRIAELYTERLGEFFPFVTNQPLVMRNKNNVPIYHFVCASANKTAVKIAQQIIEKRQA